MSVLSLFNKEKRTPIVKERRSIFNGGLNVKTGFMLRKGKRKI